MAIRDGGGREGEGEEGRESGSVIEIRGGKGHWVGV